MPERTPKAARRASRRMRRVFQSRRLLAYPSSGVQRRLVFCAGRDPVGMAFGPPSSGAQRRLVFCEDRASLKMALGPLLFIPATAGIQS
jgi:hypothetical protein